MKKNLNFVANLIAFATAIMLTTGCATTVPKPEFTKHISRESQIAAKDETKVQVKAGAGVSMLKYERTRVAEKIKQKIDERKVTNSRDASIKMYEIKLVVTKYEKGSAFARVILAGLGQIHIDGDVEVFEMPGRTPVGNFSISKTFAWGGLYGGMTGMEEIETTFADGVAAALTGQSEEQKKSAD